MVSLDYVRARKLVLEHGYIGLKVKSAIGHYAYVLFMKEAVYNDKASAYKHYPPGSAMFRHMADFIYDYNSKAWTKQIWPLSEMQLTPAEMVLFGRTEN